MTRFRTLVLASIVAAVSLVAAAPASAAVTWTKLGSFSHSSV